MFSVEFARSSAEVCDRNQSGRRSFIFLKSALKTQSNCCKFSHWEKKVDFVMPKQSRLFALRFLFAIPQLCRLSMHSPWSHGLHALPTDAAVLMIYFRAGPQQQTRLMRWRTPRYLSAIKASWLLDSSKAFVCKAKRREKKKSSPPPRHVVAHPGVTQQNMSAVLTVQRLWKMCTLSRLCVASNSFP